MRTSFPEKLRRIFTIRTLKNRIILLTVLISIIPVLVLFVSAYRICISGLMDQKVMDTNTNMKSINQAVNSTVNARQIPALRFGSTTDAIRLASGLNITREEYDRSLYSLDRFFNEYINTKGVRSVSFCGVNGSFYSNNGKDDEAAQKACFRKMRTSGVIAPWWDELMPGNEYYLPYHIPVVLASNKKLIGMITINFLESEFESTYSYYNTEENTVLLVSSDGRILSAADRSWILRPIDDMLTPAGNLSRIKTGAWYYADCDGEQMMVSSLQNMPNGLYIVCISRLSSMATAKRQITLTLLSAIVCSLFIVLLLSVFLSQNMTKPVNALVGRIRSMQTDTLEVPGAPHKQDEISIIGDALAVTMYKLQESSRQALRDQRAKREAELKVLLMQINPHFLHNSLSSAIWLIQMDKKQESIELIVELSKLFKFGLSKNPEEIPVVAEMRYIESYLRIFKIRYGNEFDYAVQYGPEVSPYRIIKLLIQPLVENAIYHGIDVVESGQGRIDIVACIDGETLKIEVRNRPSSITEDRVEEINEGLREYGKDAKGFGIGLNNVNERIFLTYGAGYGLRFSIEGAWTVVTVRVPLLPYAPVPAAEGDVGAKS